MTSLSKAVVLVALALPLAGTAAQAQVGGAPGQAPRAPGPYAETPYAPPWEKELRRFYESGKYRDQPDPYARTDRTLRRLDDAALRRLGLPPNKRLDAPAAGRPVGPSTAPEALLGIRTDPHGNLTREAYIDQRLRHRPVAAGPAAEAQRRSRMERVRSRFDSADRNRDGVLTPEELLEIRDPRF